MKTLQSNFTTPEQSKKLLELGVPANSADCYIPYDCTPYILVGSKTYSKMMKERGMNLCDDRVIPCWSVGRLIEIYENLIGIPFTRYNLKISLLDEVLDRYWQNRKQLNFSKLEE